MIKKQYTFVMLCSVEGHVGFGHPVSNKNIKRVILMVSHSCGKESSAVLGGSRRSYEIKYQLPPRCLYRAITDRGCEGDVWSAGMACRILDIAGCQAIQWNTGLQDNIHYGGLLSDPFYMVYVGQPEVDPRIHLGCRAC